METTAPVESTKPAKPKRVAKAKVKNDPKLAAAARELRDRWLEQVNDEPALLSAGKYDITRAIAATPQTLTKIRQTYSTSISSQMISTKQIA